VGTTDGGVASSSRWTGTLHVLTTLDYSPNTVGMFAEATVSYGGSASAFADPMMFIDPIFALTDPNYLADYALVLSPGIGNGTTVPSAVPEPSTWAMLLLGFAGLGWAGYERRLSARPAGGQC
jgi:hypothetical protein